MVDPIVYAIINSYTDYVEGVVTVTWEHTPESNWVEISTEDQTLIGKWYNKTDGQFYDKPNGYLIRLKTVDGAGSGLDADLLDGKHASEFALANHTHTGFAPETHSHSEYASINHDHDSDYAPISHTHTGFADADHNHDSDYSPIGHTHTGFASSGHNHDSDYADINHNHDSDYLKLSGGTVNGSIEVTGQYLMNDQYLATVNDTTMTIGSINRATTINCGSNKEITMNGVGVWTPTIKPRGGNANQNIGTPSYRFNYAYFVNSPNVSSDERLKQDVESVDIEDMLEFIEKLDVVNYAFKNDPETKRIGLIAQEVEKAGGEKYVDVDDEGMYGLKTADLVYPLISAVQALYARVMELETKVKE